MPPQQQRSPQVICAENIAFLQLLHTVPSNSTTTEVHNILKENENRSLSLKQERQLTGMLAVLSSIKTTIDFITAVAVRELRAPQYNGTPTLEILLAVNKSSPESGEPYLQASMEGLRRVLRILSQATEKYDDLLEMELFTEIVSVCQNRILSRLRFGRAKRNKQQTTLQNALTKMCTALRGRNEGEVLVFIEVTRKFIAALDDFGKHQVGSKIPRLVEEAEAWTRLGDMDHLFSKIRTSTMHSRVYQDNRQIISKVAQYRTVARRLYRMARVCQPLRNARIIPVRLGPKAFSQLDTTGYSPDLAETYKRLTTVKSPPRLATVCEYVGKCCITAEQEFISTTRQTLGKTSKVHAEIQILTYLRSISPGQAFTTRFVQSNKKACFLCNQLLTLNGFSAIPKSHGKLYPGWRIPMVPVMEPLQLQLNDLLAQVYQKSIALLLLKQKKIDLPQPYESSALSMSDVAASESTQIVLNNPVAIGLPQGPKQSPFIQVVELEDLASLHESTEESDEELSPPVSETDAADAADIDDEASQTAATDDPGQQEPTQLDTEPPWIAIPGQHSLVHTFGDSTLMVEYSIGPDIPKPKTLQYHARPLSDAAIEQLRATDP